MASSKKTRKSAKPKPAPKSKRGPRAGSKTAFVLGQPLDLPAKEIVARGKSQGIALTEAYIYGIRSRSARATRRKGLGGALSGGRTRLAASGSLENQFALLALDIGLARAESILRDVRGKLDAIKF